MVDPLVGRSRRRLGIQTNRYHQAINLILLPKLGLMTVIGRPFNALMIVMKPAAFAAGFFMANGHSLQVLYG